MMMTPRPFDQRTHVQLLLTTALAMLPLLLQLPLNLSVLFAGVAGIIAFLGWRRPLPLLLKIILVLTLLVAISLQLGSRPGRESGCALLVAMLTLKPGELHSVRDARSLLGFALFVPFSAFLLDQGPLTSLLTLLAVIATLLSLQQLVFQEIGGPQSNWQGQAQVIGRLLLVGLPLTLSAFWLVPRLATPLWGAPEYLTGKPGLADSMEPGQWLDLINDDSPVLRARFFGTEPEPQYRYWRGPVLTLFDGRTWRRLQRPARRNLLPEIRHDASVQWHYQLDYEPSERDELVVLELPLDAPEDSVLNADYTLFSQKDLTTPTQWQLRSAPVQQFQTELPPRLRELSLYLPENFNPRTLALGQQWRTEAGEGAAADSVIVNRALEWIGRDFSYTMDTPLPGRHSADEFLFQYQAGFCEHFSAAFVILMRSAGIPARIVTGYAGGNYNRYGQYWLIRRDHAHAWAEVWIAERGWVRVDPTAAVAPERILDTINDRLIAREAAAASGGGIDVGLQWQRMVQWGDWLRNSWNTAVLSFDAKTQRVMLRPLGVDQLTPTQLTGLFALLSILAVVLMLAWLARGEREQDRLLRAWHRLGRRYNRIGLGRQPHEPALQWAQRVEQQQPGSGLIALSQRFNLVRYALHPADQTALLRDITRHRPPSGVLP